LPLLLEHFRTVSGADTTRLNTALAGLQRYQSAKRDALHAFDIPEVAKIGAARLLKVGGGTGTPIVLIPSIINGPQILHLTPEYSLGDFLVEAGHRVYLVDWGPVDAARADEGLAQQVSEILLPMLTQFGRQAHLVGYCLGGLHAMAAAQLGGALSLTIIASPWNFSAYTPDRRAGLAELWEGQRAFCQALKCVPAEVLQSAFWQLDPVQLVQKFIAAATMPDDKFNHFVRVEDWANAGEALPFRAAQNLVENLFGNNETAKSEWCISGQVISPENLACPALSVRSTTDQIVPFAASPVLSETLDLADGHVGMMIGSRRKTGLWAGVLDFIRRADSA
jgi:polyhydroxyalkanoate synthase subunit PhaC